MRSFILWAIAAVVVGACIPIVVVGLGSWRFGALRFPAGTWFAGDLSTAFGMLAGIYRPRAAIVFVALFVGTASVVNAVSTPVGSLGYAPVFGDVRDVLWASPWLNSAVALPFGIVAGWAARKRKLREQAEQEEVAKCW
jgi:hypothetical protein